MKRNTHSFLVAIPALLLALSAQAHDPKEHMKNGEKPDCAAMKHMDQSKMNMNDPVMQAMMKKCMKELHQDKAKESDKHMHDAANKDQHHDKSEKHEKGHQHG